MTKEMRMPFGIHRGKRLRDVDGTYLAWLVKWEPLKEPLKSAIAAELERRQAEPDAPAHVKENLSVVVVERTRRLMAKRFHPDHGGSDQAMQAVNVFADTLIEAVESGPA